MAMFSYVARNPGGDRVTGRLAGVSQQSVLAELQARQLAPVRVEVVRDRPRLRRRVGVRELAGAYRKAADLLRAGVPLLRALRLLGSGRANPRLAAVMAAVADDVADGARLADAMAAHADVFPAVQLAMVRAGERGGFLEQVLARLGDFLEHQADLRARVVGNLIYPVALLSLSLTVVLAYLIFFVPKFEELYARIEVPAATRLVLGTSSLLTDHWLLALLAVAGIAAGSAWARRRPAVRRFLAGAQLRVPALGPLTASLAVARFARMLGTLLHNGVPMLSAMQIARDAAGHLLLVEAIDEATEAVRAGESLARPLAASGMIGEDVVEMISVGESANNLPEVLTTIAETIEKRVDRLLGVFVRLMEPLLLIMLGGVVMFIYIALVVPMMQMSSALAG